MKNKLFFFLRLIVGPVILGLILYKIGFKSVFGTITKINLYYIPIFIIMGLFILYVGGLNIKILTLPFKKSARLMKIVKYYSLSWVVSLIIPGRIGEFSIIYFLRKENISMGQRSAIVVLDKIISLAIISTLAIIGFFKFFTREQGMGMFLAIIILFAIGLFFIFNNMGRGIIKKVIPRFLSTKFQGFSKSLFTYFRKFRKELVLNFLLTSFKLSLSALITYLFFFSFGEFSISYIDTLLIYAITVIISLIPISINGLGLKEGAAVYLFSRLGIDPTVVGSVFISALIFNYLFALMVWYMIFDKETLPSLKKSLSKIERIKGQRKL